MSYDSAGRTATLTDNGTSWTFEFDAEGRLTKACKSATCSGSIDMVAFTYDGEGHRAKIVATPAAGTPVTTTEFRYQADAIVSEVVNGTIVKDFVVDEAGTIRKVIVPAGQTDAGTYLVVWNGHGDATGLWRQNADGTLTLANTYTYSTWGAPTTATHNSIGDLGFRYLYVGAADVQWDNAFGLGLTYMHARHYSPALGRFLQPDPARAEANSYLYVDNGPVTRTDPSGRGCEIAIFLGPEAVLISCAAVVAAGAAMVAVNWLSQHPIQLPDINICLWGCAAKPAPRSWHQPDGHDWWNRPKPDPRLVDWVKFLARYKHLDTISPRPPISLPPACGPTPQRRAVCVALAALLGMAVTGNYVYPRPPKKVPRPRPS